MTIFRLLRAVTKLADTAGLLLRSRFGCARRLLKCGSVFALEAFQRKRGRAESRQALRRAPPPEDSMEHIRPPAILNGSPSFDHDLLVGRPNVGDRQRLMDRLNDVLDRRWLTNHGMCVRELER